MPLPASQPVSARQPHALPDSPQFSGLHRDAVIGADLKLAATRSFNKNTFSLYKSVKSGLKYGELARPLDLVLKREPENRFNKKAIAVIANVDGKQLRIGYVPDRLASGLAPLVDEGHQLAAKLTRVQPYKAGGEWFHSIGIRLEYVHPEDGAPDLEVRDKILAVLEKARYATTKDAPHGWQMIQTIIPEEIHRYEVGDEVLTERINQEQGEWGEATYYVDGKPVARVPLDNTEDVKPGFSDKNLAADIKTAILHLVNRERDFPKGENPAKKLDITA